MRISDWSSDVCSSDLQKEAVNSARKQGVFKTKHLNVWVGARDAYFNVERWIGCAVPGLSIEDFEEIGRASCGERVCQYVWISVVAGLLKKNNIYKTLRTRMDCQ